MKYSKMLACGIVTFLMIAAMATFVSGQASNSVSGYIRDSSDNSPISGAEVHAENTMDSSDYYASSDGSGYYSINLPPGDYHVTVTHNDYQQWETDFTMGPYPESRDIQLDPKNYGGGDIGGDSEDGGFEMPFGDIDEDSIMTIVMILVSLVVVFFICLITITIALIVISSRLGKIRKELIALNEGQKPKVQAPPQYQQVPPPPPAE